tara:strand:+ start:183 stop:527 length:345 start_codon:yes stop_codon:yes gene_type:complete
VRDGGDSETNEPRVPARVLRRQLFVAGFDDVAVMGERASTFIVGTERVLTRGKWRTVEILACPVTFFPHPHQIEAARSAYDDWWQAQGWVRDGLVKCGMLRDIEDSMAKPWLKS